MERRQPEEETGKAGESELAGEVRDEINLATWAATEAAAGQVPAPRVSMELLERVAFLLRRY